MADTSFLICVYAAYILYSCTPDTHCRTTRAHVVDGVLLTIFRSSLCMLTAVDDCIYCQLVIMQSTATTLAHVTVSTSGLVLASMPNKTDVHIGAYNRKCEY